MTLSAGTRLGVFEILAPIGKGGMGEVYRAKDTKLEREVALKVMPSDLARNPERMARFDREAKALAAFNHPNIVTIYSVEEVEGQPIICMELVDGKTLAQLRHDGGMPAGELLELAVPLAEAVASAHEHGVTHRDLKPANVMVTREGRVKVLDFGLARLLESSPRPIETELSTDFATREGQVLGTAAYMSPEQIRGEPTDHRSDIFSLGVVLYEMATGARPFEGSSSAEVMSAVLRDEPRPVGERATGLPRELTRTIHRCLERRPADRFQSSRDVYLELKSASQELTEIGERAPTTKPQAGRSWPAWIAGGVATALATGAIWWGLESRTAVGGNPVGDAASKSGLKLIAVLPLRNLGPAEDEFFAAGITEEIRSRLTTVRGLGLISSSSTSGFTDADARAKEIGEELGVDFVLSGSIRWARQREGTSRVRISPKLVRVEDNLHLWAEVYDRAMEDVFDIQSEIALSVAREVGAVLLDSDRRVLEHRPTANPEAYQAYLRGRFAPISVNCGAILSRLQYLERAVEIDPTFAQAWAAMARGHSAAYSHCPGQLEEHRLGGRRALARAEELAPDTWEVLLARGQYLTQVERDYGAALQPLEKASLQVEAYPIHFAKARIYRRQGRWEEALAAFERAAQLDPRAIDARISAVLMWMRNYAAAIEAYDRDIERAPEINTFYLRKAWSYWLWKGDTPEARAVLEVLPTSEPSMYIQWGWFWQRIYEGQYQRAIEGLEIVPDEPLMGIDLFISPKALLRAQAFDLMNRPDLARSAYEEALEILERLAREAPADPQPRQALAIAYAGLGSKTDAIREATAAMELVPIDREPYFGQPALLESALVHTMVGEYDVALDHLATLLAIPSPVSVPWLRLDPRWAPLWDLPRFRELERRYEIAGDGREADQ